MPSPQARRIEPVITSDMKKKIQTAVKAKENKIKKGVKKEILTEEEVRDFYHYKNVF